MTFIKQFEHRENRGGKRSQKATKGTYSVFQHDGQKFIQLDSYGQGKNPEKVAQTVQLDRDGARDLYSILKRTFGFE
jgi:hypothetical protein